MDYAALRQSLHVDIHFMYIPLLDRDLLLLRLT